MTRRSGKNVDIERKLAYPPFWLVHALEWPDRDTTMAEAAFAVAPSAVATGSVPQCVEDVLGFTSVYARSHLGQRVVWFTDVTRWLDAQGSSWQALGVDWERALGVIPELPILGLYMTISRRAYVHLSNAAERCTLYYADGTREVLTEQERHAVHEALAEKLATDWPLSVQRQLASGQLVIS